MFKVSEMFSKKVEVALGSSSHPRPCSQMTWTSHPLTCWSHHPSLSWAPDIHRRSPTSFHTDRCFRRWKSRSVCSRLNSMVATSRRSRCSRMTTRRWLFRNLVKNSIWVKMPWVDCLIKFTIRFRWMRTVSHEVTYLFVKYITSIINI